MLKSKMFQIMIGGTIGLILAGIIWRRTKWYQKEKELEVETERKMNECVQNVVNGAFKWKDDGEIERMKKEEMEKMDQEFEKIKRQIEEGKKNDVFARELKAKINMANRIVKINEEEERKLNDRLRKIMDDYGIKRPWGDCNFREFMSNPNNVLDFGGYKNDLEESISAAREAGVPEEKILHNVDEIDDFFTN